MRIRRILFILPLVGASLAIAAASAKAGAFLAPAGHGEIITATSFSDTTRAFDDNGRLLPVPAYQKFALGTYMEYGLTDAITLVAEPGVDLAHQATPQMPPPAAAGTDFGARVGLVNFGDTILSLQGLVHIPFAAASHQAALFDQDRASAVDLRLLLGHGFAIGTMPGFLDVETSHTWQGDGLPDEWHADFTLGLRPQPQLLIMLASFMTMAGHPTAACASWSCSYWSWLKLQPSLVYDLTRQWSVELGFFATIIGQNAGRELGPMTAFWYRF
ncbi:MAG: hypothetical protein ACYC5H_18030 [Methylovirgula sp.]